VRPGGQSRRGNCPQLRYDVTPQHRAYHRSLSGQISGGWAPLADLGHTTQTNRRAVPGLEKADAR